MDLINDFYLPSIKSDNIKNSTAYKLAKANNIDTDIIEGKIPDENSGEIKFQELDDTDKRVNFRDVINFLKNIPRDNMLGLAQGLVNGADVINNLTNFMGINPDDTYEFIQEKLDKRKKALDDEVKDDPLVNKLMQATPKLFMYAHPIYKKLRRSGVPNTYAFPISVGVGEMLAFSKDETFLVDSKMIRSIKEAVNVPKDSSTEEVFDRLVQFGEYSGSGILLERIFKGIQLARTIDAKDGQQVAIAVGGGATAGAAVDKQQEINIDKELKSSIETQDNVVGNILNSKIDSKDNQVGNILNEAAPNEDNLGNNIISNKTSY
tara:strand:+ start:398 stop:1360 length:963 start_codon:yes stop_codon:yes gene_type:complete